MAATVVELFAHTLQVIGLPVRSVTGGELLALPPAFLQPEDLGISIGFRRNL